ERKKENSKAEGLDIPASWPEAMVDMEREVPGNTAEAIWQKPIQIACPADISSTCSVLNRPLGGAAPNRASTIHMMIPPTNNDQPITAMLSRLSPIFLCSSHAGPAVITKAISTRVRGWVNTVRSPRSPRGNVAKNRLIRERKEIGKHTDDQSWVTMEYNFP